MELIQVNSYIKGFFQVIRRVYGNHTCKLIKNWQINYHVEKKIQR